MLNTMLHTTDKMIYVLGNCLYCDCETTSVFIYILVRFFQFHFRSDHQTDQCVLEKFIVFENKCLNALFNKKTVWESGYDEMIQEK